MSQKFEYKLNKTFSFFLRHPTKWEETVTYLKGPKLSGRRQTVIPWRMNVYFLTSYISILTKLNPGPTLLTIRLTVVHTLKKNVKSQKSTLYSHYLKSPHHPPRFCLHPLSENLLTYGMFTFTNHPDII